MAKASTLGGDRRGTAGRAHSTLIILTCCACDWCTACLRFVSLFACLGTDLRFEWQKCHKNTEWWAHERIHTHTRARACAQASLEKLRKRKDSREDHGPCSLINFVSCGRVIQARLTCKFKHQAWLYSVWAERRYTILWASFFVCIQVAARRRGTCQAREAWSGSIRNSCFSLYLL